MFPVENSCLDFFRFKDLVDSFFVVRNRPIVHIAFFNDHAAEFPLEKQLIKRNALLIIVSVKGFCFRKNRPCFRVVNPEETLITSDFSRFSIIFNDRTDADYSDLQHRSLFIKIPVFLDDVLPYAVRAVSGSSVVCVLSYLTKTASISPSVRG